MADSGRPPQRPDGIPSGTAREWLESERQRGEPPAFLSKSGEPNKAETAGDAAAEQETGALRILKSDSTASLISIVVFISVFSFMVRGVTVGRVVLLAIAGLVALARLGAKRHLKARGFDNARSDAEHRHSGEPNKAETASDAAAEQETGALRILKSDSTMFALLLGILVPAGWLLTRGVTAGRVVLLAAGCLVALACFGATRYLTAKKARERHLRQGSAG